LLGMIDWDTVIVDEAQAIKNPDAQRTKSIGTLRRRAAFAVTGTPLENRTQDVWSLANFALPGYLGTRAEFASRLESDPHGLHMAIRPLMLRREVKDVAKDLPDKIEIDNALEMFAPEADAYDQLVTGVRGEITKVPVLALLTKLRLFTAHPDAVSGLERSPESRSAKLTRLLEIVEEIVSANQKVLVFVAFNMPAEIIRDAIGARFGIPVWALDGRTPVSDRQPRIDQFSSANDSAALVLNPSAGGVGLNIQAARHVIHYTLEWNPAREAQATARAWRRGQDHPVTVHRLYYANTIDELILEKLAFKQQLFDEVVKPTNETDATLRQLLERALSIPVGGH
jgi:SNF2 family DNA or RNA helicase